MRIRLFVADAQRIWCYPSSSKKLPSFFLSCPEPPVYCFFFLNDTATTEFYPLPLHDALPILRIALFVFGSRFLLSSRQHTWVNPSHRPALGREQPERRGCRRRSPPLPWSWLATVRCNRHQRSEEHTSELQSRLHLVCRLLLEK